jgi:hypothetical protein
MKPYQAYILAPFVVLCIAIACSKPAEESHSTTNSKIPVEKLFEYDGCTVYRFRDGDLQYFVKCKNGEHSTNSVHTENCGKNCTRDVTKIIPTVEEEQDCQ